MKVKVHLKSGETLAYDTSASVVEVRDFWTRTLQGTDGTVVRFGRFVIRPENIYYTEILEN